MGKVGNSQHFPTNLHILLDKADRAGHSHIVSWCSKGISFKIHDQDDIVPLLAKYFRQTKFKSFLRQLQSYGFHRTTRGQEKGTVSHPYFVRGRRSLCIRMSRKPAGATAAAVAVAATSQGHLESSLPRTVTDPSNLVYRTGGVSALPSPGILPLRKIHSAPLAYNSLGMNRAPAFTDISKLKNETFEYCHRKQHQQDVLVEEIGSMNKFAQPPRFNPHQPFKRRSSETTILHSQNPYKTGLSQLKRRSSDPAVVISATQRDSLLECAGMEYRSSSPQVSRSPPRQGFLLSIQESTSEPKEVPSHPSQQHQQQQQQVVLQVQKGHPQALQGHPGQLQQHQPQVVQVQRITGPQNQVRIHQLQYQQQEQQQQHHHHQVFVQYHAEQPVQVLQHLAEPQHQHAQKEPNTSTSPTVQKVYSHEEVLKQIEQAKKELAEQFREQVSKNDSFKKQVEYFNPSDAHQQQQQCHQPGQQQVKYHGMPNQQLVHQQQQHVVPHQENKVQPPSIRVQYDQPEADFEPLCLNYPSMQKTSAVYATVPSNNNFELSFSTSELTNGAQNNPTVSPQEMMPSYISSSEGSSKANIDATSRSNGSSFSVAISANPLGGGLPPPPQPDKNAHIRMAAAVQPINVLSHHHTHQRTHIVAQSVYPQQHQHQLPNPAIVESVPQACVDHSYGNSSMVKGDQAISTACDEASEEGTVDYLLQNGSGGCDEWVMPTEEVAEGLNYYGFLNNSNNTVSEGVEAVATNEPPSACDSLEPYAVLLSNHHHQHFTPIPIHSPSSLLQCNRQ